MKSLLEGQGLWRKWTAWFPTDRVQSLFGLFSSPCPPCVQIVAICRYAIRKPFLVRANPVGKTRQAGKQHEIWTAEFFLTGDCLGVENLPEGIE